MLPVDTGLCHCGWDEGKRQPLLRTDTRDKTGICCEGLSILVLKFYSVFYGVVKRVWS